MLNNEVPGEKVQLMSKILVPQQFCQKAARVGQKRHFFQKWWGIAVLALNRHGTQLSTRPNTELQSYVGVFENSSVGLLTRALSDGLGDKIGKKGGNGDKKGGKNICFPPNLLHVLDGKFNIDYDTAIKHDLILIFDIVMGVRS